MKTSILITVLSAVASLVSAAVIPRHQLAEKQREVLPDSVVPRHYDVNITPDLVSFKFSGRVSVEYVSHVQRMT